MGIRRVVLAINAHISKAAAHGPGKVGYAVAKGLAEQGRLGKVFCYSADSTVDLDHDLFVETQSTALGRKVFGLGYRLKGIFPSLPMRRVEERHFDQVAGRKLMPDMGELLFCTKPVNPDLILKARSFGWLTVMSTSVLHPRFNLDIVRQEQARLGLSNPSVYADEQRVLHLERALAGVDRIIAANDFFIDNYSRYGISPEKFVLPETPRPHEGVDAVRFSSPSSGLERDGKFRVLHVSHMTLIKGVQYLLEAWKKVEREINGELVLAGSQDADVRQLIARSGVSKIRVTGPVNPLAEYRNASVFVSPSISDAGPNTVFEAMACGTPAIVSRNCGISGFIEHGMNGLTYQYNDVSRLAELILQCYRNPEMRIALAGHALATARRFPISDYAAELQTILNRVGENEPLHNHAKSKGNYLC